MYLGSSLRPICNSFSGMNVLTLLSDVATRLSPVCCERMVEVNAVGVLYQLLNSCNRSLPHMEIIKYTVNILLNLAKVG